MHTEAVSATGIWAECQQCLSQLRRKYDLPPLPRKEWGLGGVCTMTHSDTWGLTLQLLPFPTLPPSQPPPAERGPHEVSGTGRLGGRPFVSRRPGRTRLGPPPWGWLTFPHRRSVDDIPFSFHFIKMGRHRGLWLHRGRRASSNASTSPFRASGPLPQRVDPAPEREHICSPVDLASRLLSLLPSQDSAPRDSKRLPLPVGRGLEIKTGGPGLEDAPNVQMR